MSKANINQAIEFMDTESFVLGVFSSPLHFAYEHHLYDVLAHMCSQKISAGDGTTICLLIVDLF